MKNSGLVLLLLAALFIAPAARAQEPKTDWPALEAEAKAHLLNLLSIKTVYTDANEADAARYIYSALNRDRIEWDIYKPSEKRASLVAYIRGESRDNPLYLVSHLDTVDADFSEWESLPFLPEEKDGYIYGRGAADNKDMAAISMAVLAALKRGGVKLRRDVVMLALADEEGGGSGGVKYLLSAHPDVIRKGYAIYSGGGVVRDAGGAATMLIVSAADKQYMDVRVLARGASGHAAAPPSDNAIYTLATALRKIKTFSPSARLNPVTRGFFRSIYKSQGQDARATLDMLLGGDEHAFQQAANVMSGDPFFLSQLKDTVAPTVLYAGNLPNVVPAEAQVVLNCRLLPDTDPVRFLDSLKEHIDMDNVLVLPVEMPVFPGPEMRPSDDELFSAISSAASSRMPGAAIAGGLMPGATDAGALRRVGVTAYGVPGGSAYGEENRTHGPNERVELADFYRRLRFVYEITLKYASSQGQ